MLPMPTHLSVLPNGLTLLLRETHLAPVVGLQIWAQVGSADERPGEEGLAHFHEHMLFKGTERRGVGEVAGEIIEFGGDFNKYITSKGLQKQEGVVFRHLLRLILLTMELTQLCPPDTTEEEWREDLADVTDRLTACCREVDPSSTQEVLDQAQAGSELNGT